MIDAIVYHGNMSFSKWYEMINICAIYDWAGTNLKKKNFVEGEKLLKTEHIIKCGKDKDKRER